MNLKGKILDPDGIPFVNAHVYVTANPTKGTVTDIDGNFVLNNVVAGDILTVSTVEASNPLAYTVGVVPSVELILQRSINLNEVVVTGKKKYKYDWVLYGFAGYGIYRLINFYITKKK